MKVGISDQGLRRLSTQFNKTFYSSDYIHEVISSLNDVTESVSSGLKDLESIFHNEEETQEIEAVSEISAHEIEPYLYEVLNKLGQFKESLQPYSEG